VFVDATIIRILLVPATMRILGDWNWWPGGRKVTFGATRKRSARDRAPDENVPASRRTRRDKIDS
jgi:uncharacterized membrane protein YdfJ with MMPL/SSD domain